MFIKLYGCVMGWWSMLFERMQCELKKTCKTPKNYEKHVVMEHVKREFIEEKNKTVVNIDKHPHTFDITENKISIIGKSSVCMDPLEKNFVFLHFVEWFRKNSHENADEVKQQFCPVNSVLLRYSKIRVGNCVFEIESDPKKRRYTKSRSIEKSKMDYYVQIKNKHSPTKCSEFHHPTDPPRMYPTFGRCKMIYAVKPFTTPEKKHIAFYFFKCEIVPTIGYHRSLWTIDETKEAILTNTVRMLEPKNLSQIQVLIGQHGELPEGHKSVMRIGRDVLRYAPIEP